MLSIIIPTLNEEKYLPFLLDTIKKQSFTDYEIIIADAGSRDKTIEIAKNYGCKIIDGGLPAHGRNQGVKIAKGETLLFSDADNLFLSTDFLEESLREFNQRNLGIAATPVFPRGNEIDKLAYKIYNQWIKLTQKFTAYVAHCILVKKDVFEKISGFDEEIKIAEDHDFANRASRISKFGFLNVEPISTSVRRFEKDGRLRTYIVYVLTAIHMFFAPVKSDIFKYRFGYSCKNRKKC